MRLRIDIIGFVLAAVACGSEPSAVTPLPSATVTLSADRFTPDTATIQVGQSVAFVNTSGELHDVDFGVLQVKLAAFGNGTRVLVFRTAGTFAYFCNIHAGMEATLIVR